MYLSWFWIIILAAAIYSIGFESGVARQKDKNRELQEQLDNKHAEYHSDEFLDKDLDNYS